MSQMKIDLSNRNLKKLEYLLLKQFVKSLSNDEHQESTDLDIESAIFDNNHLSKLENLEQFINLKNLSLANNHLVEIRSICKLVNLQYVNLLNNSLSSLDGFKELKNLIWINISGNQIKSLEGLKSNKQIQYIDASENSIESLNDLSALKHLQTLNLNGNEISTLEKISNYLPNDSIENLFLSYNAIDDLNEISYLTSLNKLENLCIDNNPCVAYSNGINYESMFDYRPFVVNWCLKLAILDGSAVTKREFLKAEWLYSQGKGRQFRPGQNDLLIEYLIKTCPFNLKESIEEEEKISKILEKKENYNKFEVIMQNLSPDKACQILSNDKANNPKHIDSSTYSRKTGSIIANDLKNNDKPFSNQQNVSKIVSMKNSLYFSSSDSVSYTDNKMNYHEKMESDSSEPDKRLINKSRYEEYDSKPIKPLDPKLLNKKLSEYPEMSKQEFEELKRKSALHTRAKTIDQPKTLQQKSHNKMPVRQLSFNSSNSNSKGLQSPKLANNNSTPIKIRKRSKTQDDLKKNRVYRPVIQRFTNEAVSSSPTANKTNVRYNPERYSPKINKSSVQSKIDTSFKKPQQNVITSPNKSTKNLHLKNFTKKPVLISHLSDDEEPLDEKQSRFNSPTKTKKNNDEFSLLEKKTPLKLDGSKLLDESSSVLLNISNKLSTKDQLQHLELQNRIQKQRQEMRLQREKNLKEFKSLSRSQNNNKDCDSTNVSRNILPKNLTFEDRCAIKIQSAWRGYKIRKSNLIQTKFLLINYKNLLKYTNSLKESLKKLQIDHNNLVKFNKENCDKIWSKLESFVVENSKVDIQKSLEIEQLSNKISPLHMSSNSQLPNQKKTTNSYDLNLIQENLQLRDKIYHLEVKCQTLESQVDIALKQNQNQSKLESQIEKSKISKNIEVSTEKKTIIEPKPEVHPPIRVRLQKLSEKTVALKWNHNPKNIFIQITGYHIYINNELCGTMKPNETSASIDGIQTEGEYKIFIRSFFGDIESIDSNQVITRVKKKQATETDSKTGTSELSSSSGSDFNNESNSENTSINSNSKMNINSSNNSGHSVKNKTTSDTNESIEKKMNNNSDIIKVTNCTLENINVSSFYEYSSHLGHQSQLEKGNKTNPIIVSKSPVENNFFSKKEKSLLLKDQPSLQLSQTKIQQRQQNVGHRLAAENKQLHNFKSNHSFLNESEKKQLLLKTSGSSVDTISIASIDSKVFASKILPSQSNASIASTVSFSVHSSEDKLIKGENFDKLIEKVIPVKSASFDPLKIPQRVPSPLKEKINTRKSDSNNKSISHENLTDTKLDSFEYKKNNLSSTNSTEAKTSSHSTLLADFVNNVKFSNSVPNLSNNMNKTDSTTANESISSLLRRSFSIGEDLDDIEDEDIENNYRHYSQFDTFELNFNEINE